MPLLDINFDGFSLAKLYQQRSSRLDVVTKKVYNFPEKSEQPKFILLIKISWLIIFSSFQGGNENFAEFREGSLSHLAVAHTCTHLY